MKMIRTMMIVLAAVFMTMCPMQVMAATEESDIEKVERYEKVAEQLFTELQAQPTYKGEWLSPTIRFDSAEDLIEFGYWLRDCYTMGTGTIDWVWYPEGTKYIFGVCNLQTWQQMVAEHYAAEPLIQQVVQDIKNKVLPTMRTTTTNDILMYIKHYAAYKKEGSSPLAILQGCGYGNCNDFSALFHRLAAELGCQTETLWGEHKTDPHEWIAIQVGDNYVPHETTSDTYLLIPQHMQKDYKVIYRWPNRPKQVAEEAVQ